MSSKQITLLYDGACRFCREKVERLRHRDRHGRLVLVDISADGFEPGQYGLTAREVNGALHAVRDDGTVFRGMDAVREACGVVGLGWILVPTRWPVLRTVSDWGYAVFARNRGRV